MHAVAIAVIAVLLGLAAVSASVVGWIRRIRMVVTVEGESMLPTLPPGTRLIAVRRSGDRVRPGDVVVCEAPISVNGAWRESRLRRASHEQKWLIKRVVATAGQPVPPGVDIPERVGRGTSHVPERRLVLLGDNLDHSSDSRTFGFVPVDRIYGSIPAVRD